MIKIVYCSVCGKLLPGIERNCAYCGCPLCKEHYINKLCPAHVNMVNPNDASRLHAQKSGSIGTYLCLCPVIGMSGMFTTFGLLADEPTEVGKMMTWVSIVAFIVSLAALIAINKHLSKKIDQVMAHVDAGNLAATMQQQAGQASDEKTSCPSCKQLNDAGSAFCGNCGYRLY